MNPTISIGGNIFKSSEKVDVIDVEQVIEMIKNGSENIKKDVDYLRSEKDKDKRDAYKKAHLPILIWGGRFTKRAIHGLNKASGLACIDIDDYGHGAAAKNKIMKDDYVYCAFLSPSGGLKVVVRIPLVEDQKSYRTAYLQLEQHYSQYGVEIDESNRDISRACFMSYDPHIYVNKEAKEFPVDWTKVEQKELLTPEKRDAMFGKKIVHPGRHRALLSRAGKYRHENMSAKEARILVHAFNKECCSPPKPDFEVDKMIDKVFELYKPSVDTSWKSKEKVTLQMLYDCYGEYMHNEDPEMIDMALATSISQQVKSVGEKIWVIFVGPSSDGKTQLVSAFDDGGETVKIIKNFTPKTLVNGYRDKKKCPDLAPKLRGKTILIPEMASILTLHPNDKAAVWAQLRDLYDGVAGKQSGSGADVYYKDLDVSAMMCSTPAIDSQVLIHQSLGTRELIYRTKKKDPEKIMGCVFDNVKSGQKAAEATNFSEMLHAFLKQHALPPIFDIDKDIVNELQRYTTTLADMRATAEVDYTTGELNNFVYPEGPGRLHGQMLLLFFCLKSLSDDYTDERAMNIIKHIVRSSSSQMRYKVLRYMLLHKDEDIGRKKAAAALGVGIKTVYREFNILTALDILKMTETTPNENEPWKTIKKWVVNLDNTTAKHVGEIEEIIPVVTEEVV